MRIAIVNDTEMAIECLKRVLLPTHGLELIWVARDGQEAIEKCAGDTPDIILMDLIMPVMDGVEATRRIMQQSPCAILVVTSTVSGNSAKVFDAMGAGALDAVNTPILDPQQQTDGGEELLKKIHIIGKLIGLKSAVKINVPRAMPAVMQRTDKNILAIGASTGGPGALVQVLAGLPADFPAAIVVIQHVDQKFVQGFADWLGEHTGLPVRLARQGEVPQAGTILVSNSEQHLQLTKHGKLSYSDEPKQYPYRPSVDVFLDSIANYWTGDAIGVLLTGMGKDGATGLLAMRQKGFLTIAQDQASCAVYGMPKAAAEYNAAQKIQALTDIGPAIVEHFYQVTNQKRVEHE